jgi:hypothetical protein
VGLALTWLTTLMLRFAEQQGWISEHWVEIRSSRWQQRALPPHKRRAAADLLRASSAASC